MDRSPKRLSPAVAIPAALLAAVALYLLLRLPSHPNGFHPGHFRILPIEWPAILCALAAAATWLKPRGLRVVCATLVLVLGVLLLLRVLDIASFLAFERRFSPLLEWHLIGKGWHLASTAIGLAPALGIVAAGLVVFVVLCLALYGGLLVLGRYTAHKPVIAMLAAGVVATAGWHVLDDRAPVSARVLPELADRVMDLQRSVADQRAFAAQLAIASEDEDAPPRFGALQGKDVIVIFVESYGRSYFTQPDLIPDAQRTLSLMQSTLDAAGLHTRSGWVESTTRGGRSWLAHAAFASGLRVDNQARYDRLITSTQRSLYGLLGDAGWSTIGIVPAIELAWPEGAWYDFDVIGDTDALDYRGERFGYATMPDQYTLSAFESRFREASGEPVAAEVALLSSHGPWAPVPLRIPWEAVGDGSVFNGTQRNNEQANWNEPASVREAYLRTMQYTLGIVGEYAARHGSDTLMIVLGDHQPPAIIADWGASADTPVHFITDDPDLLARLPEAFFTDGLRPDPFAVSLPMWSLRELLVTVFENGNGDDEASL